MRVWFFFIFFIFSSTVVAEEALIIEPDLGRAPIVSVISKAKNQLNLVMYGFTDPLLLREFIKAKSQGKSVNILLEPHPYQAESENDPAFRQLRIARITLLSSHPNVPLTHQKTLLIDQKQALVMTFNFTRSTFTHERNFGLLIDNPDMIAEINHVMMADAYNRTVKVAHPDLVWSPNNSREKILRFIANAKKQIQIYAQDISDYQVIGALAKAARSGKTVDILLPKKPMHRGKLRYLKNAGVTIHFSQHYHIHAKVIIIDQQHAMLGSINLTQPSIDKNRELSVITHAPTIVAQLVAMFQHDWN